MEHIINYENLGSFAYSNDRDIKGDIKAIVISFFGLGSTFMFTEPTADTKMYAEHNVVFLFPYNNPWNWMNKQAVDFTDQCVDALFEHYHLPETTPIISSGGSMGGQSALTYMAYSKRTPVGCVTNCPVCDMPFHYTERPDLPRTLYGAFGSYDCSMAEALESASPLHLAQKGLLPRAAYTVFHCDDDHCVNINLHSDKFVAEMRKTMDVEYIIVHGRDHCDLGPDYYKRYLNTILRIAGAAD